MTGIEYSRKPPVETGGRTRRKISELKAHPHQELIPPMSLEDYQNLLEDIRRNGILQPIDVTYNNVILDGHHRVKAARELGIKEVEVRIPELLYVDEDEYLISVAMNRRHLTEGQKAVLANEYRKILSEKAKTQRAEIAVTRREINRGNILSETVTDKMRELPFPVTSFTVHYFSKDSMGAAIKPWRVRI